VIGSPLPCGGEGPGVRGLAWPPRWRVGLTLTRRASEGGPCSPPNPPPPRGEGRKKRGTPMSNESDPVVLELAPLPREQIGPFLLLGLDKDADAEEIDAHWAQRVIWARKNQTRVPLEDINWAREAVRDPERRIRCDVASLNLDTATGMLRQLAAGFGVGPRPRPGWEPLDSEPDFRAHTPAVEVPDVEAGRAPAPVPAPPAATPPAAPPR